MANKIKISSRIDADVYTFAKKVAKKEERSFSWVVNKALKDLKKKGSRIPK